MPKSTFPQGLSFFPVPSALLILAADDGERQALPIGWIGVVCGPPDELTVWLHEKAVNKGLLRVGRLFAVELPAEEALWSLSDDLGRGRPEKEVVSGMTPLSTCSGEPKGCQPTEDSSVRIECRCRSLTTRFGRHRLCGEVLTVSLGGRRQEVTAALDLCRWLPMSLRKLKGRESEEQHGECN